MKTSKLLFLLPFLVFSALVKDVMSSPIDSITIDLNRESQVIEGFGGFGAKKVWWDSAPFYDDAFINLIVKDLGVNIVRTQLYWDFEPTSAHSDDPTIHWEDYSFTKNSDNGKQFSYYKALKVAEPNIKIIATVWTPPVWMKLFDVSSTIPSQCYNCNCTPGVGDGKVCGGYLNPQYYPAFAKYLEAYIRKFKDSTGFDLYGISLQNELQFANPFEACVFNDQQYHDLLKVVGERFHNNGITTKIYGPETMGSLNYNTPFFNKVLLMILRPEITLIYGQYMAIWMVLQLI
jgi:O-glycosyl hydrolase